MRVDELDYELPESLIATTASEPRDAARLMVVDRARDRLAHHHVRDLPRFLEPGDLLVFNQSKVVPALFEATRAGTGGHIKGLYLRHEEPAVDQPRTHWWVMLESRGKLTVGESIELTSDATLVLEEALGGGEWRAELSGASDTMALLREIGRTPLPPYIRRARRAAGEAEVIAADARRYNTVYAASPGSVAAPTAGLHFTPQLMAALDRRGVARTMVTLHVGLGTFAPVRCEVVEAHPIHSEWIEIGANAIAALATARRRGGRTIPVGTTSVRALESLPVDWQALGDRGYRAETDLFITPDTVRRGRGGSHAFAGFRFTDALMTNFHLPRSTLLAMVAALPDVGIAKLKRWYAEAVEQRYRFYSYGDAMLLV